MIQLRDRSFFLGRPSGQWLFRLRDIDCLALTVLTISKIARVSPQISSKRVARGLIPSLTVFPLVVQAIGTGVTWFSFQMTTGCPNGINLQVAFVYEALLDRATNWPES